MIGQTAVNLISDSDMEYASSSEGASDNRVSHLKLIQMIAEDLPVIKKDKVYSDVTTYYKSDTMIIPSETSEVTTHAKVNLTGIFPDNIPKPRETRSSFSVLQEWEGYVVKISEETFTARLIDLTRNCTIEEEEADFPLDDLVDDDRTRISIGAIFRWVIGYHRSPGGTKDRLSRIVFRRMPAWTTKEIEKNRLMAAEWADQLNVE